MGKKRQNLKFFLLWLLPKCLDAVFHKTLFKSCKDLTALLYIDRVTSKARNVWQCISARLVYGFHIREMLDTTSSQDSSNFSRFARGNSTRMLMTNENTNEPITIAVKSNV